MSDLSRIGVAIDVSLLKKFDHLIGPRVYTNRPDAFRDLIRDESLNENLTDLAGHDNCLEVLVVKGKAGAVKTIADALISTQGAKHGRLTITSAGTEL